MTKLIALLIGFALAFAAGAQAKQAEKGNAQNKKSKPAQQQQVAPKQHKAPESATAEGAQAVQDAPNSRQHRMPRCRRCPSNTRTPICRATLRVHPNKASKAAVVQPNTVPAVQSNKVKVNKTVKNYQPRHQNFHARVNPSVASVQFNQNFRIRNAENWTGPHYNVFRTYRPQWHDRSWWHSNHNHIILIGGGWYYWSSGYWYPAWGYDTSAAYYPYDGPIYVGSSPRPFDQVVADVQSILQEQGYYRGEVDGLVGPLTQEALAAYQSAQGLAPTAAIDQPTLESLGIS